VIRINLLPYREKEKKDNTRRQIFIMAGSLILFLLIVAAVQLHYWSAVADLEAEVKTLETQAAALTKTVADLEVVKGNKQDIDRKLAVVRNLETGRMAPVTLLQELAAMVPPREVWLDKLTQRGMELRVEGMARDNIAVASFMKNLEQSSFFAAVDLVSTLQTDFRGSRLQQFVLSCALKRDL
jgi:type IV pilus assembly protein PilN